MAETVPVRQGESFAVDKVERYLRSRIQNLPQDPLTVTQFAAGHSNLTYLLKIGNWEGVLRRPPLGPVAPKAHDMQREYNLLRAVHPHVPAAPEPYVFCEDVNLIGAPFYVMKRLSGIVVDRNWPESLPDTAEARRAASEGLIRMLAMIHNVGPNEPGIAMLGHPDGYMRRQVEGWIKRHQLAQTDAPIPHAEEVGRWLLEHLPTNSGATLIHNDYKFNNVLLDERDPSVVKGVVDWEMATLGDPLSDLAITLSYWAQKGDHPVLAQGVSAVTTEDGFPTRAELMEMYAREIGRDLYDMAFYMTFAYFKAAGIVQQIYYRYWRGQTKDERFAALGQFAKGLVEVAAEARNLA